MRDVHGGVAQAVDLRLAGAAFQTRHRNCEESLDASPVEGKLLDASALHDCRDSGAAGGQQGRDISGDRNLFGGTTHFEREIDYRALTGHEGCFALPILHTWGGYGEAIVAGRQRRKHEKAGLISDGLEAVVGLNVFEEDGGIRYYSPTAMENSALNLAHAGLGAHERGQHTQTQSK